MYVIAAPGKRARNARKAGTTHSKSPSPGKARSTAIRAVPAVASHGGAVVLGLDARTEVIEDVPQAAGDLDLVRAEPVGDLGLREALEEPEHEDVPIARLEPGQGGAQYHVVGLHAGVVPAERVAAVVVV